MKLKPVFERYFSNRRRAFAVFGLIDKAHLPDSFEASLIRLLPPVEGSKDFAANEDK